MAHRNQEELQVPLLVDTYTPNRSTTRGAPLWKVLIIILGGLMMSILAGTTNAFGNFATNIQKDMGLSDSQIALIGGLGLLGVYFVLPAGYALDRWGPVVVGVIGTILTAVGYVGMSFVPKTASMWILLLLAFCLVSFGSGGVFMSALGTSISVSPSGAGWGVAIVSAGMSLSVAFTIFITGQYSKLIHCTEVSCWRKEFLALGVLCGIIQLIGSLLLLFFRKSDYPHLLEQAEDRGRQVTFVESLKAFTQPIFWALLWGFFVGIGSSVFVLLEGAHVWKSYNPSTQLEDWGPLILVIFSFANAGSNTVCGILCDWLSKKRILSYSGFISVFQLVFAVVFIVIGVLLLLPPTGGITLAILLASVGLSFGCYLVVYPIVIAETYGAHNFGKYFAYLELSSSLASVIVPQIAVALFNRLGNYTVMTFGLGGLLFTSALGMALVARAKHKQALQTLYMISS